MDSTAVHLFTYFIVPVACQKMSEFQEFEFISPPLNVCLSSSSDYIHVFLSEHT